MAEENGVRIVPGSVGPVDLEETKAFLSSLGEGRGVLIKAVAGGGGRGMRAVHRAEDVEDAYASCRREALQAFGNGDLYVEELLLNAKHIEVQVIGDGSGAISHLGERDCSIQRRHQKLIEIAPSPGLSPVLRERLTTAAVRIAEAIRYSSLGTFEFLVDATGMTADPDFAFIEANPRLQVEHTVTEEVTGIDLVRAQLQLAGGSTLKDLGLQQADLPEPRGFAVQARVNMETMGADGGVRPSGGRLSAFETPSGLGVRCESAGYAGYAPTPNFDSLLAKVIGHSTSTDVADAVARTRRALSEFNVSGVATNIPFLQSILNHPDFLMGNVNTHFVDDHIGDLLSAADEASSGGSASRALRAGADIDNADPLAALDYARTGVKGDGPEQVAPNHDQFVEIPAPPGTVALSAPVQGTVVKIAIDEGDLVHEGQELFIMSAMKMEQVVLAKTSGKIHQIVVAVDDTIYEGHPLAFIEEADVDIDIEEVHEEIDLDHIRPDLAEAKRRHEITLDAARPEAVERRHNKGKRTARENIADLCDPDTFMEYGPLVFAAQRQRRSIEELIQKTPADGLIAGVGSVNGRQFGESRSRTMIISYDDMVFAGTQGLNGHTKTDRMAELAGKMAVPLIFIAEGAGGRSGDTDRVSVAGQDIRTWEILSRLSALVPMIGITTGRCFAGNASVLGLCDCIIATEDSVIGMGGPAVIEGGGLGVFLPEEVGPMSDQVPNGVVDIAVADEVEAVAAAKQYLSYFQGVVEDWECADQRLLRRVIPENRLRIYDIRAVIETMADTGSVLELRPHFGIGTVTAFVRVEGRPIGIVANNPAHLGGAMDSDACDKVARFAQICDAFDIPMLSLVDTPGMMVGPEVEKTALVRHCSRVFVTLANISVPFFSIVLRKSYGLGTMAMMGGSARAPLFNVAWPTGEYGGMGLEAGVKLGRRAELQAIEDIAERKAEYDRLVAASYERGKALNAAAVFEVDDVIDPAETRHWIVKGLQSAPPPKSTRGKKKRPYIDTW